MGAALVAVGGFLATYGSVIMTTLSLAASIYMAFSAPGPPEGPKIGDTKVQTSTYGKPIPIGFGQVRLAGNIIWALEIEEVKNKVKVGGKGAPKQTVYTYFGHFAVGLAEGPAVICSRVWADKKVILDFTGQSAVTRKYEFAAFRFFSGDSTQLPDPLIEADLGVGSTPAYRGRCYMTVQDLPLEDMGNRVPHMEFEVQFATPTTTSETELDGMFDWAIMMSMEDRVSGYLYFIRRHDLIDTTEAYSIGYLDLYTNGVIENTGSYPYQNEDGFGAGGFIPNVILPFHDGRIFVAGRDGTTGQPIMVQINPITLDLWGRWDLSDIFNLANDLLPIASTSWTRQSTYGTFNYGMLCFTGKRASRPYIDNDKWLIFDRNVVSGGKGKHGIYADIPTDGDGRKVWAGGFWLHEFQFGTGWGGDSDKGPIWPEWSCQDDNGRLWVCGIADNDTDMSKGPEGGSDDRGGKLWRVIAKTNPDTGRVYVEIDEFDLVDLDPDHLFTKPVLMVWDRATNTLTIWGEIDSDSYYSVLQYDIDEKRVINTLRYQLPSGSKYQPQRFSYDGARPAFTGKRQPQLSYFKNGTNQRGEVYYPEVDAAAVDKWVVYNAWDFSWTDNQAGPFIGGDMSEWYWHMDSDKVYSWNGPAGENPSDVNPSVFYRQVILDSNETLDAVVKSLIADVRVDTTTDVSTDATMAATIIEGFIVATQGSVRSAINPLGFCYFFDAVESDSTIAFRSRGTSSIRTIQEADLGSNPGTEGKGDPDVMVTERMQETEIPYRVDLTYMDKTRNYMEGNQHAQRMENPSPTQFSNSVAASTLPVVMTPQQAKNIAEAKLYDSWAARLSHRFQLGPKHMDLEPTDIIQVSVTGSPTILMRLAQTQLGEAFVSRAEGATHDPEVHNIAGIGALAAIKQDLLTFKGPTSGFLMDIPLLSDTHDAGGETSGVYVGFGGMRDTWFAGSLKKSETQGATGPFEYWETSQGESPWGYLETALPALPDVLNGTLTHVAWQFTRRDFDSEIKVTIVGGEDTLQSVTHEEMFEQGLNHAVLFDAASESGRFEVIQFQNVSVTDGVATLTNIIRGMRGSETDGKAGWGLTTGVVFLHPSITTRKAIPLSEIGQTWVYHVETARSLSTTTRQIYFESQGNDLKPYAVGYSWVSPAPGSRSGSAVVIQGWRRSRLGGEEDLEDDVEFILQGETTLEYSMDLIHKTTGDVDKTYTTITNYQSGFSVSVVDRTNAGYTNDEAFTVRVYQLSSVVGRGFPREMTV